MMPRDPFRAQIRVQRGGELEPSTGASGAKLTARARRVEIARDGRLTLPMPEPERERVLRVKRGDVPVLAEVVAEIRAIQSDIENRLVTGDTPLPEAPDLPTISEWSVSAHRRHWAWI